MTNLIRANLVDFIHGPITKKETNASEIAVPLE